MESLDDTFGPRIPLGSQRARVVGGFVVLLGGVPLAAIAVHRLVIGVFSAWIAPAAATQTAVALSGLFVPAAFALAVLRLPAARPVKLAAVGGVVAATLAVALFLITVSPGAFRAGVLPPTVGVLYGAGALVSVTAPLATMVASILAGPDRPGTTGQRRIPGQVGTGSSDNPLPTDGGRAPDRLDFLLDDR